MKLKEVCRQTGLTQKTIRFYEEKQLISPVSTTKNGRSYREYSEDDVKVLQEIAVLRKSLFSIEEIYLMQQDPEEISEIVSAHTQRVNAMAEQLTVLSETLGRLDTSDMDNVTSLARAMDAASVLPLPASDVSPHFRYIDELELKEIENQKLSDENRPINSTVFVEKQNFYERKGLLSEHFPYDPARNGGSSNFYYVPEEPRSLRIMNFALSGLIVICTLLICYLSLQRRIKTVELWNQIKFWVFSLDAILITVRLLTKRIYRVFSDRRQNGAIKWPELLKYTGGFILVLVVLWGIYLIPKSSLSTDVSPDITIVIGSQQHIDESFEADLENMFGRHLQLLEAAGDDMDTDQNDDGNYEADVLILQLTKAENQQLLKDAISSGSTSLFLLDHWSYEYIQNNISVFSELEWVKLPDTLQNTDDPYCYDLSFAPFISDIGLEISPFYGYVLDVHNKKFVDMTLALLEAIKDEQIKFWY